MLLHRTPTYKFTAQMATRHFSTKCVPRGTKQMQTICITVFVSDWCITNLMLMVGGFRSKALLALRDEENANNALDQNPPTMSVRFVIHKSLTITVIQIVRLSKSTLGPFKQGKIRRVLHRTHLK